MLVCVRSMKEITHDGDEIVKKLRKLVGMSEIFVCV